MRQHVTVYENRTEELETGDLCMGCVRTQLIFIFGLTLSYGLMALSPEQSLLPLPSVGVSTTSRSNDTACSTETGVGFTIT